MNTLMLWPHCGPVLCQSHHSTCIQEPVTVRMTHCGEKKMEGQRESGRLVGGGDEMTSQKENYPLFRVILKCYICSSILSPQSDFN